MSGQCPYCRQHFVEPSHADDSLLVCRVCGFVGEPTRFGVRICASCGGDDLVFADEMSAARPFGTGYVVLMCAECGEVVPNDRTRATRYFVGC